MKTTLLSSLLFVSALANADTIVQTEKLTVSLAQASNGTTIIGNGYFAFVNSNPGNPVVIGISDLTQFYLPLDYYYFGVYAQRREVFSMVDLASFAFGIDAAGNETSFTLATNPLDPTNPDFSYFHVFPNTGGQYGDIGPDVGAIGLAYGPVDPMPVAASTIPEPFTLGLVGLMLGGLGIMGTGRKRT